MAGYCDPPKSPGGRRPGGGRKKLPATILKEKCIRENVGYAEEALEFIKSIWHDEKVGMPLRVECAKEVMDRIWGKSHQSNSLSGDLNLTIVTTKYEDPSSTERLPTP